MVDGMTRGRQSAPRVIRVFVSSTFRDMQAEREHLIKHTFPQLRKMCEARSVTWAEVDLRWGVTEEQKAEGQVLPICLDEIRRCRPYFIGLLAERYGWILDGVGPAILAREPWLENYLGRSVTEIEMVSGVLDNPEMADHAFFYFRDPAASAAVQAEHSFEPSTQDASARLAALKDRIRNSSFPLRDRFRTAQELGDFILADFTQLIDRLFPQELVPDPLERETALHELFASNRARVYIGRDAYYEKLDAHARGDGAPLVVLGASGLGKSALLANWVIRYRSAHPQDFVFMHFLGASPASADWTALARRLIGELNGRLGMTIELPDETAALRMTLARALRVASEKQRIILLLDGLNQLDDNDQAPDLLWLPRDLPQGVRLIASTLPGRALDEIGKRGWQSLELTSLRRDERARIVSQYLAQYAKALSEAQIERVTEAPLAGNPLFLTALLEELRVWGVYETLEDQIRHYVSASSIDDLFQRILARYEGDYDCEHPGLVRDALSAIWAGRHGLSEAELLDLLGRDGEPLPRAFWSPLYLAAERSLVSHSGLLGFFHDYLRQAVRERYLSTEAAQREAHLRVADYFASRELGPRKVAELPWQLARAQAWEQLQALLADLTFLKAAMFANASDVDARWSELRLRRPESPMEAYRPVIEFSSLYEAQIVSNVQRILGRFGYADRCIPLLLDLRARLQNWIAATPADPVIVRLIVENLNSQAATLSVCGEAEKALPLCDEAAQFAARFGLEAQRAFSLLGQAFALCRLRRLDDAWAACQDALNILSPLEKTEEVRFLEARARLTQAEILEHDRPAVALDVLRELEPVLREFENLDAIIYYYQTLGAALIALDRLDEALKPLGDGELLCLDSGNLICLTMTVNQKARVYLLKKDWGNAASMLDRHIDLCRQINNPFGLAASLNAKSIIARNVHHDFEAAVALLREREQICRQLGDQEMTADALVDLGYCLQQRGDRDESLVKLQEAQDIGRKLSDKRLLAKCLCMKAEVLESSGRLIEAIQGVREAENLFGEAGDLEMQILMRCKHASLYALHTRMPMAALPSLRQALEIAQAHGLLPLSEKIQLIIKEVREKDTESHPPSQNGKA